MNLNELGLNDEQVKGIQEYIAKQVVEATSELNLKLENERLEKEKIIKNKEEILNEKKNLKTTYQAEKDELLRKSGDFEALEKNLKEQYGKQLADKDESLNKYKKLYQSTLKENTVNNLLSNEKERFVNDSFFNTYKENLLFKSQVIEKDGDFQVVIGDKTANMYIQEHLSSDSAKGFLKAPVNNGSGGGNPANITPQSKEVIKAQAEQQFQKGEVKLRELIKAKQEL